jgi:hypothetical protein
MWFYLDAAFGALHITVGSRNVHVIRTKVIFGPEIAELLPYHGDLRVWKREKRGVARLCNGLYKGGENAQSSRVCCPDGHKIRF